MTIEQSAKKATASQRCFLVDFQTRATAPFIEAMRRVHARRARARSSSAKRPTTPRIRFSRRSTPSRREPRKACCADGACRASTSGDIITEQNIHTLDVMNWIMAKPPVSASGTGGRKFRNVGTCWDTFSVTYKYADDVGIAFTSRQFDGFGTRPEGIRNRMFGTEGVLETEYGGQVLVRGKDFYNGGKTEDIYERGAVNNIAAFHDAIVKGDYSNPTVAESVRSNLVTILGRTAAYEGRVVTWDELMKSDDAPDAGPEGTEGPIAARESCSSPFARPRRQGCIPHGCRGPSCSLAPPFGSSGSVTGVCGSTKRRRSTSR